MGTRLRSCISVLLAVTIAMGFVVFDKKSANAYAIKEIDLYSNASDSPVTIPENYRTSYQITLADLGLTSGEISGCMVLYSQPDGLRYDDYSYGAVCVTNDGLVTPGCWYWNSGFGTNVPPEDGNYTSTSPYTGTATVRVYLKDNTYYDITFHHHNYDSFYAEKVIDDFIAENITSDMSVKEIVTAATKWTATSFDYGNTSSAYSMIIYGYGDCWASTDLICKVCEKCGLHAWARNGNKEPGAGSGHRNAIVEDKENGVWYVGEAGYTGKAPRMYSVYTRTSLYCYNIISMQDKTIELYQIDMDNETYQNTTSIKIPSQIEGYTVTSLGTNFLACYSNFYHVSIPDTVKTLKTGAFQLCTSLTSVDIPSGVASIGDGVFYRCESLRTVKIPLSVASIGDYAFYGCDKLTDIYYEGSESDWKKIEIGTNNDVLSDVTIHYGSSPKNGWEKVNDKWSYYDLGRLSTGWQEIDNNKFYFDKSGIMQTGWQFIEDYWYYFNESGMMQTGWLSQSNYCFYLDSNGRMANGFQYINKSYYYFAENGTMATGWKKIYDRWYYFGTSGILQTGLQQIDDKWYFLGESGCMETGWQSINGESFYFADDGYMVTGWKRIDGAWYYFDDEGYVVTGWYLSGGYWYYLEDDGVMFANGWKQIDDIWYYFNGSGAMVTGWMKIGGKWYYFKNNGAMAKGWQFSGGEYYYLTNSGEMATGWKVVGGKWYYFYSSGAMAHDTTIDGYTIDSSGAWVA